MRIGNNVAGAECFYAKITPELIKELRTKQLLGLGEQTSGWDDTLRSFKVMLPTYRTKPGKKKERVKLPWDQKITAYCFNVMYSSPLKNGELKEWEISVWN